jgi:uncharacterized protein YndB with AHSA1/START domain
MPIVSLFASLAAARDFVAPAAASLPIPLTGTPVRVDAVEQSRYLSYAVGRTIAAPPAVVWAVLVDGAAYPTWNSTVTSLEGAVVPERELELRVKIDPRRTYELDVSAFVPERAIVWEDGSDKFRGRRTFTLAPTPDGGTEWTMREVFTGSMMKMIAPHLPDFTSDFQAFGDDLAREAERRSSR